MITSLKIENFKSLRNVEVKLTGFNLFLGTNSSGKSNFLDAMRLLQGIGNGFTLSEILNGKPRTATSELWDGIRGGAEYTTFREVNEPTTAEKIVKIVVRGRATAANNNFPFIYNISFSARSGRIVTEWLSRNGIDVFDSIRYQNASDELGIAVAYSTGSPGKPPKKLFERTRPVLHQFADFAKAKSFDRKTAAAVAAVLADVQRLDPSPEILRQYSVAQQASRMGERGENFAALVSTILADEGEKRAYLEWLQELSPADVDDVLVLTGALKEPLFAVVEGGKIFPAQVLSDGTLRFAAIAAAFFQDSMPAMLTLEEIEKGVHPNRLRLLVELLRSQTRRLRCQVIATTHSPDVIGWLTEDDLDSTFIANRQGEDGSSTIRALGDIQGVKETLRDGGSLAEMFSEGWLEAIA